MAKHINTFIGGMDADTNVNSYSNQSYPDALNLRIFTDDEHKSGTLTSIKEQIEIYNESGKGGTSENILAFTIIGDSVVLFSRFSDAPTEGVIKKIPKSLFKTPELLYSDLEKYNIIRKKEINFSTNISVVARYESEDIQKIYWADGVNPIRVINIAEDLAVLNTKKPEDFNLVNPVTLQAPKFSSVVSGQLKAGMYQYAYCLYEENGSETTYSPASKPIPISESQFNKDNSLNFKGSHSGEITQNGIEIELVGVDTNYTNCRVIRMYYSTQDGIPEVEAIYEGTVEEGKLIVDGGTVTLGTLILEDYRALPNLLTAKLLESKNDYLFAANTKEEYFDVDFDARAFRFSSIINAATGGVISKCKLWKKNYKGNWDRSGTYIEISGSSPDWNVSMDYLYNPYNEYGADTFHDGQNMYQRDGLTLGGEGANIKYTFTHTSFSANSAYGVDSPYSHYSNNYQNMSNPIILEEGTGYQRGDVYRFGVVFYDKYGRQSDVKYVDDIRFPFEGDYLVSESKKGVVGPFYDRVPKTRVPNFYEWGTAKSLGIKFTLTCNIQELKEMGIVGWQVVRAERTYQEARIKDCGYAKHMPKRHKNETYGFSPLFIPQGGIPNYWEDSSADLHYDEWGPMEYITAETTYNKNNNRLYPYITVSPASVWRAVRTTVVQDSQVAQGQGTKNGYHSQTYIETVHQNGTSEWESIGITYTSYKKTKVSSTGDTGKLYATKTHTRRNIVEKPITNGIQLNDYVRGIKGTTLILGCIGEIKRTPSKAHYIRRAIGGEPYGGYNKSAVYNTVYYPCSSILKLDNTDKNIYGGDCYISVFEYNRVLFTDEELKPSHVIRTDNSAESSPRTRNRYTNVVYMPVESKINLNYTINDRFSMRVPHEQLVIYSSTNYDEVRGAFKGSRLSSIMWETKGAHSNDVGEVFLQDFDLYTYNPVYSTMDKSKVFFMLPEGFKRKSTGDVRIYRTQKKINGEISDTWSKFYHNNFLDVDTAYGGLSALKVFKNKLLFFQDRAVGTIPVEEREIVTSDTGNKTVLGEGGVLERCDYISTSSGFKYPTTLNKMVEITEYGVYYIDTYNNTINRIGEQVEFISDMKGVKSKLPKDITKGSIVSNPKYRELWVHLENENTSLVFNEYTDTFISRVDSTFNGGFSLGSTMYTIKNNRIYLQDSGDIRNWSLSLHINPNNLLVNRFDSITFGSINADNVNNIPFSNILLSNRFQESRLISLNNTNIRHRFRNWVFNKLRDITKERFYDSFLSIKLTGTNPVEIHDIITEYSAINTL